MLASVIRSSLLLIGLTAAAVVLLRDHTSLFAPAGVGSTAPSTAAGGSPAPVSPVPERFGSTNQMVVKAGPHGHFFVDGQVRSRKVRFLVDTGASFVTLSRSDAERLGYAVHQLDYSGMSHTANGMTRFAPVIIDEIAIGDIVVRDVQASVIDSPMEGSLLGMAFLRRLAGFEVSEDRLILKW